MIGIENFGIYLLVTIGLSIFFIYKFLFFYFLLKGMNLTESPRWIFVLHGIEYVLAMILILLLVLKPYTSNHQGGGDTGFVINPAINYLLFAGFLIIVVRTTFTVPISIYNTLIFIGVAILSLVAHNYISSFFRDYSEGINTYQEIRPQIIAYSMLLPVLYVIYKFSKSRNENIIFSMIPMLVFFFVLIYSQTNHEFMPYKEHEKLMDDLGLRG